MALQPLQISLAGITDRATNAVLAAIISALNAVRLGVGGTGAWVGVAGGIGYTNGWVDVDATRPVQYRIDSDGQVYLRGGMSSGTMNAIAFTLPAQFRPLAARRFAVDSAAAYGALRIGSDGAASVIAGSNASVFCDGSFYSTN